MKVGIGRAATELGVSRDTLRRWEAAGKIAVERTPAGHRRYDLAQLRGLVPHRTPTERITLAYARVSMQSQKKDLKNQVNLLEDYCLDHGWEFEVIEDLGSGVNYRKSGLRKLIQRICDGDVGRLVMTDRDRLLRFGIDLVFAMCENFRTEVVIMNVSSLEDFEDDIAEDILEIITVFSARLYGSHNDKNQKIIERLMDIAKELAD
ncbi:IS607 family transposase [Leptolyngbya sp. FACHB-36]|uniref:IS607 family transposase n=1 Tax=Leptolyngbya sp. FACHB-36 TaxID=2692808 RepID=UPI001680EB73|nr:IS607 family transposase [Leptolyngbya sp. FACHB-36]MBD2022286.1 IS607 family transposase [Leptolyngbya sp. FACHB-36]